MLPSKQDQAPHTISTSDPNSFMVRALGGDIDSFTFTYEQTVRALPDLGMTETDFVQIRGRKATKLAGKVMIALIHEDIAKDEELIRKYRESI